jgi:hypothetical protein
MLLEHRQQIEQLLAPLNAYGRHALPPAAPARDTSQDRPALTRPLTCPPATAGNRGEREQDVGIAVDNSLARRHVACAWISLRAADLFG